MSIISWVYYPGTKSMKERLVVYEGTKEVKEEVEKLGFFNVKYHYPEMPELEVKVKTQYTKNACNHGRIEREMREEFPNEESKVKRTSYFFTPYLDYFYFAGFEYVLTNISSSSKKKIEKYISNENFIKQSAFIDEDFLDVFKLYIERENRIEKVLFDVQIKDKDFFDYLVDLFPVISKMNLSPVGKKAKVKTLKAGNVKLVNNPFLGIKKTYWDGKEIIIIVDGGFGFSTVKIIPEDDMEVIIEEENTVTAETEFVG